MHASGGGVFETLKVVDGVPFAWSRHMRRLRDSAAALGLPPVDASVVRAAVDEALVREARPRARLRVVWGAGSEAPSLQVEVTELPVPPNEFVDVATAPWPRTAGSPVVSHKTTAYAENLMALSYATERGADEALLVDTHGRLCEGTGTNVFVVVGGQLLTPTLATGCLPGITRELVLEWTSAREADVSVEEARAADEMFVASSTRDVRAVRRWDDVTFPAPGPVTAEVVRVFAERAAAEVDP